jgi:predicted deacylase
MLAEFEVKMITVIEFIASKEGPSLLFLGAIHGNEKCGPLAINKVISDIQACKLFIERGRVAFVPICNPLAYTRDVRCVEEDLNRVLRRTKSPQSYEGSLANILCDLIDRYDVIIDIHSITARGKPFICLDYPTEGNLALARILGPDITILGWPELCEKIGPAYLAYDTTAYAAKQRKDSVLIECGQHTDRSSVDIAYGAVVNSLLHYSVTPGTVTQNTLTEIRMSHAFFRRHKMDRLVRGWNHLDRVQAGEAIISNADGSAIVAPSDAYIIMPNANAEVGEDWLYLGERT